jgi:ubiquinol-cytochrome c reductase cytochrome c1 subunit
MKKFLACVLTALVTLVSVNSVQANEGGPAWDKFPTEKANDVAALQHGAKLFVNYCLNCHQAAFMRYTRLRDLDLTDVQIKQNLLFATDKIGETMKVSLDPKQAKAWFGAVPPDLTLVARSRAGGNGSGSDYLYTYLRKFYRDDTRPTGWNNLVFPNVGMPHVLWELQGERAAKFVEKEDPHEHGKTVHEFEGFEQLTPGTMSDAEFNDTIADLVAYMQWMAEPVQQDRVRIGVCVLLFLLVFTVFAWRLNAAYWKDVK